MQRPEGERHKGKGMFQVPKATAPFYWHDHANERIDLYHGKVYVVDPNGRFFANGAITATWRPNPYIKADAGGPLKARQLANPFFAETSIQPPSRFRLLRGLHPIPLPAVPHHPPRFS